VNTLIYMGLLSALLSAAVVFNKDFISSVEKRTSSDLFVAKKSDAITSAENRILSIDKNLERLSSMCPLLLLNPKALAVAIKASKVLAALQKALVIKIKSDELSLMFNKFSKTGYRSRVRKQTVCRVIGAYKKTKSELKYYSKHSGTKITQKNNDFVWSFWHPEAGSQWF